MRELIRRCLGSLGAIWFLKICSLALVLLLASFATTGLAQAHATDVALQLEPTPSTCNDLVVTVDLATGGVPTTDDDVILGTPGPDVILGLAGDDTICGGGGDDQINGGPGMDTIFGGDGDDFLAGRAGIDVLMGEMGVDSLNGGGGDDLLDGGSGDDDLRGQGGDDTLEGGPDVDQLIGGAGDDVLNSGDGGNLGTGQLVRGGNGNDIITGSPADDDLVGGAGIDEILGLDGDDRLRGGNGSDDLFGGPGADILEGAVNDDNLHGGDGDDVLLGGGGDDELFGESGDDSLDGQAGIDLCDGGDGSDTATPQCETEIDTLDDPSMVDIRISHPSLAASVNVIQQAPVGASEVQLATDPSFQNAPWNAIGQVDLSVPSTGVQELFLRYRSSTGALVGGTVVTTFTLDGPLQPLVGSEADPEFIRVSRVARDVLQVDFELGEVTNVAGVPVFIEGPALEPELWDAQDFVLSADGTPLDVIDIGRISTPTGQVDTTDFSMRHQFHVRTNGSIPNGEISINLPGVDEPVESGISDREWSPAVKTSDLGWGTADVKRAFVTVWTTTQSPVEVDGLRGEVVDAQGTTVLQVNGAVFVPNTDTELYRGDLSGGPTAEFVLDGISTAGTYRFCVESIGCSSPFEVTDSGPWASVLSTVSRSLFHQRSGITLEQPFTAFERPRAHHPDEGWSPTVSEQSLFEDPNGRGDGPMFEDLVARATEETVSNAWGGHFDAGDWDRRIQHLWTARRLVDLVDQFDEVAAIELQIPESGDGVPDLLDEALWGIDAYRRLQLPDGAIRGGIESEEHPLAGTTSWTDPLELFVYAPDAWSSWIYSWVVADAAYVLDRYDSERAAELRDSAVRAMEWAEAELEAGRVDLNADPDLAVQRTNAAASLYRATEDEQWNELFLATSPLSDGIEVLQCIHGYACEGAWRYATLPDGLGDDAVRQNAADSIIAAADWLLVGAELTAYGWVPESVNGQLFFGGGPSNAHGVGLMYAYLLTGEDHYRDQVVLNAQFALGANPAGRTWITGIGFDSPDRILGVDQRSGFPVWPGTPLYGLAPTHTLPEWYLRYFLRGGGISPDPFDWPYLHGFADLGEYPGQAEFTVHQSHGVAIWTFGALAGT